MAEKWENIVYQKAVTSKMDIGDLSWLKSLKTGCRWDAGDIDAAVGQQYLFILDYTHTIPLLDYFNFSTLSLKISSDAQNYLAKLAYWLFHAI